MTQPDEQLDREPPEPGTPRFFSALDAAVAAGVDEALLRHKRTGEYVVEWRQDAVATVPVEDVVSPVDASAPAAQTSSAA